MAEVDQYTADLDALTAKASPAASGGKVNPERSIADLVGQLREVNRQEESDPDIAKTKKQLASDTEALDAKQAGVKPFDVKPWDADKEKAKRTTDPIEAFGSFGSIFGILASAFTHRPMINSLNAAAAAMNAVKANDHEAYKSAFDAWKENTQLALDRHRVEHEDFTDALSKLSTDASLMKVYAAKYGDKKAELLAEAGLYEHLATYAQAKENAAMQLATYAPQIEKWGIQKGDILALNAARKEMAEAQQSGDPDKIREAAQKHLDVAQRVRDHEEVFSPSLLKTSGKQSPFDLAYNTERQRRVDAGEPPMTSDEIAALNQKIKGSSSNAQSNLKPETVDLLAKTFLATGQTAGFGFGGKGDREAIYNRASELAAEQGISMGDVLAGRSSYKADTQSLGSLQKMSDSVLSFENTALMNMKIAEGLAEKGSGTELGPVINRWLQAGKKATGDPDVKAFDAAIQTVANEYAKIMSGATGAQAATEGARAEAQAMVNAADSPRAIRKVFNDVMRPDMENRRKSLTGQTAEIKKRIGSNLPTNRKSYSSGDVIDRGGKKYRVTGGDPYDPDIEPVTP